MKIPKPNYEAIGSRSLLYTCECNSLIQKIEEHVIVNKEPFLHIARQNLNCNDLLHYLSMDGSVSATKSPEFYFHLGDAKNIDFKIDRKRKHKKLTVDEYLYKDVVLTLVYF